MKQNNGKTDKKSMENKKNMEKEIQMRIFKCYKDQMKK